MRLVPALSALAAASLSVLAGAREPDVKLPDIGSSAASLATPQELREYGAGMLQEMRAYDLVVDDPLLADYINALGYRLVASSDQPDPNFTFFIVRDDQINAFAAPGGYVATNAGLITAMDTEDELAGVLAHEISHVEQQHILRAFEDQKKMSIPIMLGMLGVMIASAHRTDDAAAAAMMTGTSLIQQRQINFTRGDEAEADRVGIQTLARAGFDPMAMAGAFQALQKVMRVNGIDIPEFLLDHPLDTRRIADAKARAEQLGCPKTAHLRSAPASDAGGGLDLTLPPRRPDADGGAVDEASALAASAATSVTVAGRGEGNALPRVTVSTCAPRGKGAQAYFELMRERVRVQIAKSPTAIRSYYANNLRDDPAFDSVANRYGYALALIASRDAAAAIEQLRPLIARQGDSPVLRLALADAQDQAGRRDDALATFAQLHRDFPGNRAITLAYSDALVAHADAKSARLALDLLRPLVERNAGDPGLQRSFARANELAGDKVRASEAYAEAAWLSGHAEDALNQLKALSKQADLSYYQRSRIDARIAELTPAVLALRKRSSPIEPGSLTATSLSCCRVRAGSINNP
ncbi:M48 family metalloprotease [Dokdonella fugitiva]|uniref:beta-barrel assembly-enhancing protease n=1 Tax=Dokdonella fugitiva TaxID=328517 RepID=UPI0015FA28B0|nr:M48 family metalloprotease [Dokdonella fugitiva]MBA8883926.1 putative Zn-dependent protease [Dokdonella fugitiva]